MCRVSSPRASGCRRAPIADPDLVPQRSRSTLGLRRAAATSDRGRLRPTSHERALLVLDNFEQVLPAARVVGELLRGAARLTALVTSRAPLSVSGEQEFPVPPLALPDRESAVRLVGADAVRVGRAVHRAGGRNEADFSVTNENAPAIAEICVRLDGLPLAIELAAARMRFLSPQRSSPARRELACWRGGARDLPERHRTLRAAIGWSYELLEEPDRSLIGYLSVFAAAPG